MSRKYITKDLFHAVKRSLADIKKQHPTMLITEQRAQIADYYELSVETIRVIGLSSTWQAFLDRKAERNDNRSPRTKAEKSKVPQNPLEEQLNQIVRRKDLVIRDSRITSLFRLHNRNAEKIDTAVNISAVFLTLGVLLFLGGGVLLIIGLVK